MLEKEAFVDEEDFLTPAFFMLLQLSFIGLSC